MTETPLPSRELLGSVPWGRPELWAQEERDDTAVLVRAWRSGRLVDSEAMTEELSGNRFRTHSGVVVPRRRFVSKWEPV